MTNFQKTTLALSRITLGWFFFYAGITKVLGGDFSASGYLKGAKTFAGFYNFFLSPQVLPVINFLNEWGLTLVGISLILGAFTRLSSFFGAGLLVLYYFPILGSFPAGATSPLLAYFPFNLPLYLDAHSFLVDLHILGALAVLVVGAFKAGRFWGMENLLANSSVFRGWYQSCNWLG